jgi:hypothetical protein
MSDSYIAANCVNTNWMTHIKIVKILPLASNAAAIFSTNESER